MESLHKTLLADIDFDSIFESDESIRFVGVCSTSGKLLDVQYRRGIVPLLSDSGLQFYAIKAAIRHTTRLDPENNLGRPLYSVTSYENVKRATISIEPDLLLLIAFEKKANETTVLEKILSVVKTN